LRERIERLALRGNRLVSRTAATATLRGQNTIGVNADWDYA
jgi:hypothetical protein